MIEYRVARGSDGYWYLRTTGSSNSVLRAKDRTEVVWLAAAVASETGGTLTVDDDSTPRPRTKRPSFEGLEALYATARVIDWFLDFAERRTDPERVAMYTSHARTALCRLRDFMTRLNGSPADHFRQVVGRLETRIGSIDSVLFAQEVGLGRFDPSKPTSSGAHPSHELESA